MKSFREVLLAAGAALFLVFPTPPSGAEGVRTVVAAVVQISEDKPEGESVSLGYSDAVAVNLAPSSPFIQGIELEIRIPKPMQSTPGAFAWSLYTSLNPSPATDRVGYDGERIIMQPFPTRAGLVLQIPVSATHSLRTSPYVTVLPVVLEAGDLPLMFKLSSLSKGLSAEQEKAEFLVKIRPIFTDEGALRLTIVHPEDLPGNLTPNIFVDEKRVESWHELMLLKKGPHTLRITGEGIRDETRSFATESGKIFAVEVKLQGTKPVLIFEAPANAVIQLDEQQIDHTSSPRYVVEPGEKTVVCRIGDYTITRKFQAARGKTYRIIFSMDVQIQENP